MIRGAWKGGGKGEGCLYHFSTDTSSERVAPRSVPECETVVLTQWSQSFM